MFTFNIDILWKENAIDTMWINEWECSSNDNCTAKSSVCSDGLCQCAPGYIFNADMTACIKGSVCFIKTLLLSELLLISYEQRNYRYFSQLQLDCMIHARKQSSVRLISSPALNVWKMSAYVVPVTTIYTEDVTDMSVSISFFLFVMFFHVVNDGKHIIFVNM